MDINKTKSTIEQKYFEICQKVVIENDLELYDVEYIKSSSTLRIFIYDKNTKTAVIEDCVKIDRAMTPDLEADWVANNLVLEVSSPGMYRPLKSLAHFEMAKDQFINCVIIESIKGAKGNKVRGKLIEFDEENIKIEINDDLASLAFSNIKKANLDPSI